MVAVSFALLRSRIGFKEHVDEQIFRNSMQEPDTTRPDDLQHLDGSIPPIYGPNPSSTVDSDTHNTGIVPSLASAQGAHYMSHWLEAGFAPEQIPNCMY